MLIPSFVDYLFPNGPTDYIKSGTSREFTNMILFSPAVISPGLIKSSKVHPELIKTSITNGQRRGLMLECLDEMEYDQGQFFRVDLNIEKLIFKQGLEIYQIKVTYYQQLKESKLSRKGAE